MDKEEILAKSRKENENGDEREQQIRDKSIKWTYITMVFFAAVFAYIRAEQGYPMMDLCATVSISVCAGQVYRFVRSKNRGNLVIACVTFVLFVLSIIRFVLGH